MCADGSGGASGDVSGAVGLVLVMVLLSPRRVVDVQQACAPDACPYVQAQWAALETMLATKQARSIGVSNFCQRCFRCLNETATVQPMLNQIQYHAG